MTFARTNNFDRIVPRMAGASVGYVCTSSIASGVTSIVPVVHGIGRGAYMS